MSLPTTPARDAALADFTHRPYLVLQPEIDTCTQSFGVPPCLATGTPCYKTIETCKYKSAYTRGSRQLKFSLRGAPIPAGETLRPYVISEEAVPMAIDVEAGLARRGMLKFTLADEPCPDNLDDPYYAQRAQPAGGTFWSRLLARNPNFSGRPCLVRRGFYVEPFDWTTFVDERYLIDQIALNKNGTVTITLKDPLKLADRKKIPAPTDGRLTTAFKAYEHTGYAVAATSTTIQLDEKASAVDGAYVGMEVYIRENTGSGQRRTITAYAGASRTATVSTWLVTPDTTSIAEISVLAFTLDTGKGGQYPNPATSGKREFVQIGEETIEYTAKSGDTLSWTSSSCRAAFGSKRADHKADDSVVLCRAWIDVPVAHVLHNLLNEGDIADAMINLVQLYTEVNQYLGPWLTVTTAICKPEDSTKLLAELLAHTGLVGYWLPHDQKVHIMAPLPHFDSPPTWTDNDIKSMSISVDPLHDLRITSSLARIGKINQSGADSDANNFSGVVGDADVAAMSTAEYGDDRPDVFYSRWFTQDKWEDVLQFCTRRVQHRRDAPRLVKLSLNRRASKVAPGEVVIFDTGAIVGVDGANEIVRAVVTKIVENSKGVDIEARIMNWAPRPAFIATDDAVDYPSDAIYDHISQDDGLMPDGTDGFAII
ncbi:MAG: hypothetical protein ACOY4U_04460 [Pseudomonadota bacterium]